MRRYTSKTIDALTAAIANADAQAVDSDGVTFLPAVVDESLLRRAAFAALNVLYPGCVVCAHSKVFTVAEIAALTHRERA